MKLSPKANLQLIYVSDIQRSTAYYKTLFNAEPVFESPRYVAFSAGGDALFALWSGGTTPDVTVARYCEIGITLPGEEIDTLYQQWLQIPEINIIQEPYTDVFGRTFMVKDPDGHLIRVSPID